MNSERPTLLVESAGLEHVPVLRVPRAGSVAQVRAGADLIALLGTRLPGRAHALGAGYMAPLTLPFGLAVTAALGALGEPDPLQDRWTVRSARIEWRREASWADTMTAHAIVEQLTERDALVGMRVTGSDETELLRATTRFLPMSGNRYAPAGTARSLERIECTADARHAAGSARANGTNDRLVGVAARPPLWQIRAPNVRTAGAVTEVLFAPDVLQLLVHPIAGSDEPLGRRLHPLGGAPLGAALTAALVAAGEADPDRPAVLCIARTEATWYLPLSMQCGWVARSRGHGAHRAGGATFDVREMDGRVVLSARVETAPR